MLLKKFILKNTLQNLNNHLLQKKNQNKSKKFKLPNKTLEKLKNMYNKGT